MSLKNLILSLVIAPTLLAIVCCDYTTITIGNLVLDISDTELPWLDAVASCRLRNQQLLSVSSAEKDRLLVDLFVNGVANVTLPGNNTWISATEFREGAWVWNSLENQPLYYTRWMIGQPDDLENINCAYQSTQALLYWRDANCSAPMYYICESGWL